MRQGEKGEGVEEGGEGELGIASCYGILWSGVSRAYRLYLCLFIELSGRLQETLAWWAVDVADRASWQLHKEGWGGGQGDEGIVVNRNGSLASHTIVGQFYGRQ